MKEKDLEVKEDTAGTWSYHLATTEKPNESLCGEKVMGTGITLDQWGNTEGHLPMTFCGKCKSLADQEVENE
jgi:hypothetical protein